MNIATKAAEMAIGLAATLNMGNVSAENLPVGYIKYSQEGLTHQLLMVPDREEIKLLKIVGAHTNKTNLPLESQIEWEEQLISFLGHSCKLQELELTSVSKESPLLPNGSLIEVNFDDLSW